MENILGYCIWEGKLMLDTINARQLLEITRIGFQMLTFEEFLQIVDIFSKAADRAENEGGNEDGK